MVVVLFILITSIGCKNGSASNNANIASNNSINEISGEVFPGNEVCHYADLTVTQDTYKIERTWGKYDDAGLDVNFRYICLPYPAKQMTLFNDVVHKITVSYDARGNRAEGAHTIYIEYRASSEVDSPRLEMLDEKYRKNALLPLITEIVKRGLKQPLPPKLAERILKWKKGPHRPESCEKVGNGFVCVDNYGNGNPIYTDIYICSNEAALKSNL
ncbi:MAG: hypothetical protein JSS81_16830 [Acidobacteria bacterium]|nr:hypothetical protein [Acidobacteriota bacterium]